MADKVGKKTGKKTEAGRDVYLTDTGEQVSEKSVTIKFGEGAYVNAPSIHDGVEYSEDEIKKMLLDGKIKPTSRHDTLEEALQAAENRSKNLLNEGGMAKQMAKQMELFDEGGLLDEGGTVDEESGNDVPTGSLKKEVRDDIPAQLSEGEFVMPADVVRFHGLDKMMALRDEAKIGLARMEAMGQMGNSDEATLPDDVPFGISDLIIVDSNDNKEYNVGGLVPNTAQQPYGVVQPPAGSNTYSVPSQFQPPQPIIRQQPVVVPFAPVQQAVVSQQPQQPVGTNYTFEQLMPTVGGVSETREYRNAEGNSLYIPFINGEPIYPIPEGYFPYTPEDAADPTQVNPTPVVGRSRERVLTQEEERDRDDADAARRAADVEKFGEQGANAKIALSNFLPGGGDVVYGVNILSGMGRLGSLNFLRDEIPDDAEILLKNGDDEIILTGEEYNRLRTNVRRSTVERGRTSPSRPSDYDTSREDIEKGRARVGEKAAVELIQSLQEDEDDGISGLTDKQMNLLLKSYTGVTDYTFDGGQEPEPEPQPKPEPKPEPEYKPDTVYTTEGPQYDDDGFNAADDTDVETGGSVTDYGGDDTDDEGDSYYDDSAGYDYSGFDLGHDGPYDQFGGGRFYQQGGLVSKPKPKPKKKKKMKRGGLASKK